MPSATISVKMDEKAKAPPGMIHQIGGVTDTGPGSLETSPVRLLALPGFEDVPAVPLHDYWLDRYEVTNKQFREFLDKGGHRAYGP